MGGCCSVCGVAKQLEAKYEDANDAADRRHEELKALVDATGKEHRMRLYDDLKAAGEGLHSAMLEELGKMAYDRNQLISSFKHDMEVRLDTVDAKQERILEGIAQLSADNARMRFQVQTMTRALKETDEKVKKGADVANRASDVVGKLRDDILAEIATSSRSVVKMQGETRTALSTMLSEERDMRELDLAQRIEEHRTIFEETFLEAMSRHRRDVHDDIDRARHEHTTTIRHMMEPIPSQLPPVVRECMEKLTVDVLEASNKRNIDDAHARVAAEARQFQLLTAAIGRSLRDLRESLCDDTGRIIRQHKVDKGKLELDGLTPYRPAAAVGGTTVKRSRSRSPERKKGEGGDGGGGSSSPGPRPFTPTREEVQRRILEHDGAP